MTQSASIFGKPDNVAEKTTLFKVSGFLHNIRNVDAIYGSKKAIIRVKRKYHSRTDCPKKKDGRTVY